MKRLNRFLIFIIFLISSLTYSCSVKSIKNQNQIFSSRIVADSNVILPPAWAFGVLYGGYTNQEQTIERIKEIQNHDYPIDAYWIDSWFWSFDEQGKGPQKIIDFVADTMAFPDREMMWNFMEDNKIKGGFWIWDCILETGNEIAFKEFDSLGYFSNTYYEKNPWHNNSTTTAMFQMANQNKGTLCGNIDFKNPDAANYFKNKMKLFFDEGADFLKLDRTTNIETVKTIFEISQQFGKETKGRGFMLSHATGLDDEIYKRYPAKWTSDTRSDWNIKTPLKNFNSWVPKVAFQENIEMFTDPNKESSKIPFLTNDTGGFDMGITNEMEEELYIRWVQFSAFNPIMELFSQPENKTFNLAFNYSARADKIFREYSHLRMELFPYIYSYALLSRIEGKNIIRPIDNCLYQYYFGNEFMVSPVYQQSVNLIEVYFPEGNWVNFWTAEKISGGNNKTIHTTLDHIPLFVKEGSIIPMRPYYPSIEAGSDEILILHIFPGSNGVFNLLQDDGISNDYLSGIYAETKFELHQADNQSFKLIVNKAVGSYEGMSQNYSIQIKVHTREKMNNAFTKNNKFELLKESEYVFSTEKIDLSKAKKIEIFFN